MLSPSELESCLAIAACLHPAWDRCSPAVRMATDTGIPVLNLGSMPPRAICERLLAIRRAISFSIEPEQAFAERTPGRRGERRSPSRKPGTASSKGDTAMFGTNYDLEDTLTSSDLLAEIGLNPGAIQDVIDENHAIRCPDPRDAAGGDPLTVTAALTAGTE